MKANAPEKIYFSGQQQWSNRFFDLMQKRTDTDIEYTRTDAFIEKVLEWMKNRAERFVVNTPLFPYYDYKKAVEDFRKYMEGE